MGEATHQTKEANNKEPPELHLRVQAHQNSIRGTMLSPQSWGHHMLTERSWTSVQNAFDLGELTTLGNELW